MTNIAKFDVDGDGGDRGFQLTPSTTHKLKLRLDPALGVQRVMFQVYDPNAFDPTKGIAANPPRASNGAPTITLDNLAGSTGQAVYAATPTAEVDFPAPTGVHSYIVRCVVNKGMRPGPDGVPVVDPDLVYERMLYLPGPIAGTRKVVSTESVQGGLEGWAEPINALLAAAGGSGETNTTSNEGGGDASIALPKDGVNLPFRTISGVGGIVVQENGQVIEIDGSGIAAGSTGQIQYNDGTGGFAAESGFEYAAADNRLTVGNIRLSGLTIFAMSGDVDNLSVPTFAAVSRVRLDANGAPRTVRGLAGGTGGLLRVIENFGDEPITFPELDAGAETQNQFAFDVVLNPGEQMLILYESLDSKWLLLSLSEVVGLSSAITDDSTYGGGGQSVADSIDDLKDEIDGKASTTHAATHIKDGSDELDGDQIDIDVALPNIVPDTSPGEVSDAAHLGAILRGISNTIGAIATGQRTVKAKVAALTDIASLTGTSATPDGTAIVNGDVVLATAQTNQVENGPWVVGTPWTRPVWFADGTNAGGTICVVQQGATKADSRWLCTSDDPSAVVGTNNLVWSELQNPSTPDLETVLGAGNDANGIQITGLPAPSGTGDATRKQYVDDADALRLTGGPWAADNRLLRSNGTGRAVQVGAATEDDSGNVSGWNRVRVDAAPSNAADLTRKDYVDARATPTRQVATTSATASDGDAATASALSFTPVGGVPPAVYWQGVRVRAGDLTAPCYFSDDGGTTADTSTVASGHTLHWNGSVAGFQLEAGEELLIEGVAA